MHSGLHFPAKWLVLPSLPHAETRLRSSIRVPATQASANVTVPGRPEARNWSPLTSQRLMTLYSKSAGLS